MRICLICILVCNYFILFAQEAGSSPVLKSADSFVNAESMVSYLNGLLKSTNLSLPADDLALFYHQIGLKFFDEGKIEEAIEFTEKGKEIREGLLHKQSEIQEGLSRSYSNLGGFHRILYESSFYSYHRDKSTEYFRKVINFGPTSLNINFARACVELGIFHTDREDYTRAMQYFNMGRDYCFNVRRPEDTYTITLARIDVEAEDALMETKELSANERLKRLLAAKDTLAANHDYELLALSYGKIAIIYSEIGEFQNAKAAFEQTIFWHEELWKAKYNNRTEEWLSKLNYAWNNFGNFYLERKQWDKALNCFDTSLKLKEQRFGLGLHPEKSAYYVNVGEAFLEQGKVFEAIELFHSAIENALLDFKSGNFRAQPNRRQLELSPFKANLLYILEKKAEALQIADRKGLLSDGNFQTMQTLRSADVLTDIMRREHRENESKFFWRNKTRGIYGKAINAAYENDNPEQAFYFFEKSKAVLLRDALSAASAKRLIPELLAKKEGNLLDTLQKARAAFTSDPKNYPAYILAEEAYTDFLAELEKAYPIFSRVKYATEMPELKDVQEKLQRHPKTDYVHFFHGKKYTFLLHFNGEDSKIYRRERNDDIDKLINDFLKQFQDKTKIESDLTNFNDLSERLYKFFFSNLFQDDKIPENLVLLPDGIINLIPFSALKMGKGTSEYLLNASNIRYAYSITVLDKQKRQEQDEMTVLGMAPFSSEEGTVSLAASKREVERIQSNYDGKYLFDLSATKDAFLKHVEEYPIVHLSTHAQEEGKNGRPQILFYDEPLTLSELYTLNLNSNLVILSACETNLGENKSGEGVLSLSRGFTYAGAQSIISSLWKVNDGSTEVILKKFYEHITAGKSKAAALNQAKRDYLKEASPEWKSPYFWAGISYSGVDGGLEIKLKKPYFKDIFLVMGGIILIILLGFKLRKNIINS